MSPKPEKNVKREVKAEADDDDDAPISLSLKSKKKPDQSNGTRPKPTPAAKVKKEEDRDYEDHSKPSSRKTPKKLDKDNKLIKKIKVKEEEVEVPRRTKAVAVAAQNGRKAKKVYDLPGQKHDPPEDRDPLRIFYETLHQQVPKSEMAAFWMMEWGLLPSDEAKKVYEKKLKRNQQQKLSSPTKKSVSVKKATDTQSPVKKANVIVSKTISKTASKTPKMRKPLNSSSDDDFTPLMKKFKKY